MPPLAASAVVALAEIDREIGNAAEQVRFHLTQGGNSSEWLLIWHDNETTPGQGKRNAYFSSDGSCLSFGMQAIGRGPESLRERAASRSPGESAWPCPRQAELQPCPPP